MSLVIAHRGCSGRAPENTVAAFGLAIEMKVDLVELDVQFSNDKEIMVIHDETVQRTTNGRGEVAEMTREEIQQLDAGSWFSPRFKGRKVPTLAEVFQLVKPSRSDLLIEIKEGGSLPHNFEKTIVGVVQRYEMQNRVIVQSFSRAALGKTKQADPSLGIGLLIDYRSNNLVTEARAVGAETLVVKSNLIKGEIIEEAHRKGLRVFVWTVNRRAEIKKMLTLGVDGIITDYPERVHQMKLQLDSAH
jgi:glycerophosphoryl diester phosphodiesterase